MPRQINVFADEAPEHLKHALHGLVHVEHFGADRLLAGKCRQLSGDFRGSLGGFINFMEIGMKWIRRFYLVQGQFPCNR